MGFYFCSLYCLQNLGQLFSKNHPLFSTEPSSIWYCMGCCFFSLPFFLSLHWLLESSSVAGLFVVVYIRNRVAVLSIFRLPESDLVLKNRESSLHIWTIEALKPAIQTSNTTAAICFSAHLANSGLFKDLYSLCFVCCSPLHRCGSAWQPWALLMLETCTTLIRAVTVQPPKGQHRYVVLETLYYSRGYCYLEE